ncbi:MAG: hypothetical protein A2145_03705 [candidate division Zixibacteria bacterium RBG_16_40_9]|nr:MAG: hypothetical protein A2145_03705 [candidate division Zixibacteria bacterium RBG_16_40_9]
MPKLLFRAKSWKWLIVYSLMAGILSSLMVSCGSKATRPVLPQSEQFVLAKKYYDKKKYRPAAEEFQKLIFNYPGATVIDTALYYLANSYFHQEDYATAAGEFKKILSNYANSTWLDEAAYMVAMSDLKQSAPAELDQKFTWLALDEFNEFVETYPDSPLVTEAKNRISELRNKLAKKSYKNGYVYLRTKDYTAALLYFKEILDNYPDTVWAKQALFQIAEVNRFQNKIPEAIEVYKRFLELYPKDKLAAKCKERLSELENKKS